MSAKLQLQMAAKGAVSGKAAEWPVLKRALIDAGYDVDDDTPALELRRMAREVIGETE